MKPNPQAGDIWMFKGAQQEYHLVLSDGIDRMPDDFYYWEKQFKTLCMNGVECGVVGVCAIRNENADRWQKVV